MVAFVVSMRYKKAVRSYQTNQPPNETINRIAVPSDYIMNGGKIKEVKNYENTVQRIQNHINFHW